MRKASQWSPATVNAAQRLRCTPDGRSSHALTEPAYAGNQTLLRQLSHSAQVVRRDPPADAKKTAPPAPASPAPGPAPSPAPDAAKTDEVKLTIPWDEILKGNTTLMQVLIPGLQPPAPAAGGAAPAPGAGGAAPAPAPGGATPKGPVKVDPAPPPVAPLPAPAGPAPDAPSRLALKDFGNLSMGLRLGFPDLKTDPDPNAPPSGLQQAIQTGEIINYDMTGKLPTAYQIDKGKLVGACWGLFSKYVAPDFAAKIAKGMSGKSAGGGISYELDGVLLPDFSGGGVSFTLKFGGSTKKRAPAAPDPGPVQPKLKVGSTSDPLEAEADRAADHVMRTPDSAAAGTLQRKCAACADEDSKVHTKNNGLAEAEGNAPPIVSQALSSPGQALDAKTRSFFEQRFDADFSQVRLHSDALAAQSANAVHARAYATGNHIVLGAGESASPSRLLAHELAHVVQQLGPGSANARRQPPAPRPVGHEGNQAALRRLSLTSHRIQRQLAIGVVSDPLEAEADRAADHVMRMPAPRHTSSTSSASNHGHSQPVLLHSIDHRAAPTLRRAPIPGWNFTPADYAALKAAGKALTVSSDSGFFPAKLQQNLLNTLDFLLGPQPAKTPPPTEGVNAMDLFHGHVVVKKDPATAAAVTAADAKQDAWEKDLDKAKTKAMGKLRFDDPAPSTKQVTDYKANVDAILPNFTALLTQILAIPGAAVVYHTYEFNNASDLQAQGQKLGNEDPRRQYKTPLDTNTPAQYSAPKGATYEAEYTHLAKFSFLVDSTGVIHVRPFNTKSLFTTLDLSTITGKPYKDNLPNERT
jgi:Domain of unknown function (DUF4157)